MYRASSARSSASANMLSSARKLTPRLSGGPSIVKVLPEPVWPYAKMHTLYL